MSLSPVPENDPRAVVLITGSELTRGETKDLNGPFLATQLTMLGVHVNAVVLLPDAPSILAEALRRAIEENEIVLLSGGLGPTADDHTVDVLAEVFSKPVLRHPQAQERMRARAMKRLRDESQIPRNYYKQAEVIEGAEVFLNPVGLAPGMAVPTARGFVGVLPGVPSELRALFRQLFVPHILKTFHLQTPRIFRAKIFGHGESWAEARIQELAFDVNRIEYGISAKPGELLVKFISHQAEDHDYIDQVRARLEEAFGEELLILPEGLADDEDSASVEIAKLVHDTLLRAGITVATAESCTGGLIAKRLTDHAGSSGYFMGSVVAYDNRVKESMLGVPGEVLREHGAVSEPVCAAMALGARRSIGTDVAVSVTGIAGPGGESDDKPVGLVYLGLATGERDVRVERHRFWGSRDSVRLMTTIRALEMLRRHALTSANEE